MSTCCWGLMAFGMYNIFGDLKLTVQELSEREVADLIKSFKSTKGLSRFLVDQALQKRNYNIDNITLIVISLQEYARFRQMIDEN